MQRVYRHTFSILAWGRNAEGQCGALASSVVPKPQELQILDSDMVTSVSAGHHHSACVVAEGSNHVSYTWGSGRSGKLGHGTAESATVPTRVESLVGRAFISDIALGHEHSLFLDKQGSIWSCGENKEGQCGLGTAMDVIAQQRRAEFAIAATTATQRQSQLSAHGTSSSQSQDKATVQESISTFTFFPTQPYVKPFVDRRQRQAELELFQHLYKGTAASDNAADSMFRAVRAASVGLGDGVGLDRQLGAAGFMPGQHCIPTLLGRDLHPLLSERVLQTAGGADLQTYASVAASKSFSIAATTSGDVYTFGGGYNGELGNGADWATAATAVRPALAALISEHGGAQKVAAGSSFAMCLTRSGKVICWGKLTGVEGGKHGYVVHALSGITDIAADGQHAVMTDGERVWMAGRLVVPNRFEAQDISWSAPLQMLQLQCGVKSVSAGGHAASAVTDDGRVWMWGTLMEKERAGFLQNGALKNQKNNPNNLAAVDWSWAGFGSQVPKLVAGLQGVQQLALGSMHALALVA